MNWESSTMGELPDPARKLDCQIISALIAAGSTLAANAGAIGIGTAIGAGLGTAAQHIKGFVEGNPWWEDPIQNMKNDLVNIGTSAATAGVAQGLTGVGEMLGNAIGTTAAEGGAAVATPLAPTPAAAELGKGLTATQLAQEAGKLGPLSEGMGGSLAGISPTGNAPLPGFLDAPALQYAHTVAAPAPSPFSVGLGQLGGNAAGNALRAQIEGQDVGRAVLPGLAGSVATSAVTQGLSGLGAPGFTGSYVDRPAPTPNPVAQQGGDLLRASRDMLLGKDPTSTLLKPLPGLAGGQASDLVQKALTPEVPNIDPFSQRQGLYGQPGAMPGAPRPYGAPGLSRYDEIAMGSNGLTGGY